MQQHEQPEQQAQAKKAITIDMFTTIPAGAIGTFKKLEGKNEIEINIAGNTLIMDPASFDSNFSFYKQAQLF